MNRRSAFVCGVLVGKTLTDLASAVALTDTQLGREIRRKLYARRSMDRLLRTEVEIGEEITRRIKASKGRSSRDSE
jgi:hypothetical protein